MEKLLSLQKSVSATWLNFGSTTWAMDMILAFACGLGIFLLLLPFLPDNPPVPPPPPLRKKKGCRKYHMVRKDWCKIRKRSCALRGEAWFSCPGGDFTLLVLEWLEPPSLRMSGGRPERGLLEGKQSRDMSQALCLAQGCERQGVGDVQQRWSGSLWAGAAG
ncbi:PREDICTED: spermatogenesis-associated protein 31C1-like isoform X1 [Chinchilla lanigera]|uniref:spermatogenesis-associated protein 31C1-like isoform X1 n=1 Tax=Chinchilla lanigera TaxID=34839 RepID=UPI00069913AB|nr:PREDICTED: spermatogenesis-associated protein 31C1-like isoform X1 [Chinchilla lanigera]